MLLMCIGLAVSLGLVMSCVVSTVWGLVVASGAVNAISIVVSSRLVVTPLKVWPTGGIR